MTAGFNGRNRLNYIYTMKDNKTDERIRFEVEKTLEAARHIRRVDPDPHLYQKIRERLVGSEQYPEPWLSRRSFGIGFSMIALIITFNIYIIFSARNVVPDSTDYVQNVFEEISREFSTYTGPYNY